MKPPRIAPIVTRGALVALLACVASAADAGEARRPYRIGVLNEAWAANHPTVGGLKEGLRELGFVEGRDVDYELRFTGGKPGATSAAAQDLVKAGVDLLFTSDEPAAIAAMSATNRIPVVFTLVGDPVRTGLVKSLAHPEGNVTGISSRSTELMPKRLEVLKKLVPELRRVWFVVESSEMTDTTVLVTMRDAARRLGLELVSHTVKDSEQVTQLFKAIKPGDALLAPSLNTLDIPATVLETARAARVPAVFTSALWVTHGALVSYGPDFRAQGVQAARLVAKIIRGAAPRDMPVEGADKIDLAVNLNTAGQLGLAVPRKILFRADVIQR